MPKALVVVLLLSLFSLAQAPQFNLDGRVVYEGSYPLARWQGVNTSVRGTLRWNQNTGDLEGRICVDLARFDSGNWLRDSDARLVFEVDRFPQSCFEPNRLIQSNDQATLVGVMELRGIKRELRIAGRVTREGTAYRFAGSFNTRFTDWGMNPPTLILVTVDNNIKVNLEARITPRP